MLELEISLQSLKLGVNNKLAEPVSKFLFYVFLR